MYFLWDIIILEIKGLSQSHGTKLKLQQIVSQQIIVLVGRSVGASLP